MPHGMWAWSSQGVACVEGCGTWLKVHWACPVWSVIVLRMQFAACKHQWCWSHFDKVWAWLQSCSGLHEASCPLPTAFLPISMGRPCEVRAGFNSCISCMCWPCTCFPAVVAESALHIRQHVSDMPSQDVCHSLQTGQAWQGPELNFPW